MPTAPSSAQPPPRAAVEARKLDRLRRLLGEVLPHNAFYSAKLARVPDPAGIAAIADLTDWPFTFKDELVSAAAETGQPANLTWESARYVRFHQTTGTHGRPLPVFDTAADWKWWMECWRIVLDRAGVTAGDRILVASSFGPYAGFWSGFEAAVDRGAMAIPSGGLTSLARLELIRSLRATVLLATPSYALHLAEVAADAKLDTASLGVRVVIVAGEPGGSVRATRERIGEAWSADVLDHAGATEVGPWGVGDLRGDGLDVIEEWFHPEFLALGSGAAARPGELAELVLTTLGRTGAPVIRYRTGDVVRPTWASEADVAAGACPWVRLEGGIVGRTDDMLVIRGVNVFPHGIEEIVRGFPEVVEHRLTVFTRESLDELSLEIEDRLDDPDRVARELRVRLGLRVDVKTVPIGSLPRFEGKGRRIVDRRDHVPESA